MNQRKKNRQRPAHDVAQLATLAGVLLLGVGLLGAQDAADSASEAGEFQAQRILDMRSYGIGFGNGTILPREAQTATLKFDIAFGAFRHDLSHNAAWVFFKVRAAGTNEWQHVRLAADRVLNPTGYGGADGNTPIDLLVPAGADGFTGLFVRLADQSPETTLKAKGVTAIWDFTANRGFTKDTKVEMRVFGIRMMYVPKGPFWLGSGAREMFGFHQYTDGKQDTQPFKVTGPGAIPTGKQPGRLWARGAEPPDGGEIPATFPNGYAAFYCMENPLDGVPFAAYLNTLTQEQANSRFAGDLVTRAETVTNEPQTGTRTMPNYTYIGQNRSKANGVWNLSYLDGALYSAWAGLRPMTELEYEKALRGFREPMPNEAGYSYWGMNFGGGIYNGQPRMRVVSVNAAAGRQFLGTNGLGALALPADWPREDAVGVATRGGWGAAGVGFQDTFRTSDRHMSDADAERRAGYGWRAVRTAPVEAERQPLRE